MNFLRTIYYAILNFITTNIHWWKRQAAIQEAKRLHLATRKQYHVIPIKKGYIVVNKDALKIYNAAGKKAGKPHISMDMINKLSVFSTKP